MITKYCALALEWWLRNQGKFEGAKIRTRRLEDGSFEIFEWDVLGVDKPTDESVNSIVLQYEAQLVDPKVEWAQLKEEFQALPASALKTVMAKILTKIAKRLELE